MSSKKVGKEKGKEPEGTSHFSVQKFKLNEKRGRNGCRALPLTGSQVWGEGVTKTPVTVDVKVGGRKERQEIPAS